MKKNNKLENNFIIGNNNNFKLIIQLFNILSDDKKIKIIKLLILQFFSSILEMISVGALLPFIALIFDSKKIINNNYISNNIYINESNIDLFIVLFLIFTIITASITKIFQIWYGTKLAFDIGTDLTIKIYDNILKNNFSYYFNKKSSELIDTITNKIGIITNETILPFINIVSNILTIIFISSILLYINYKITILLLIIGISIYIFIMNFISIKLVDNSKKINMYSVKIISILQETFLSIRHIIIEKTKDYYLKKIMINNYNKGNAQSSTYFISIYPKYGIELIAMLCLIFLAINSKNYYVEVLILTIPELAAIILGIQKLLPLLNQIYHAFSSIKGGKNSLIITLNELNSIKNNFDLKQINATDKELLFERLIEFREVSFSYPGSKINILNKFNLVINKGERIAITGASGTGKSTIADLLLGLIEPCSGKIFIDDQILNNKNKDLWHSKISHVDQNIYIKDSTIIQNITYEDNYELIDREKINSVVNKADLLSLISKLPDGLNSKTGENGLNLSGGEKQRIAIARALYRNTEVIIFDEVTSSLDFETENKIIDTILKLNKTVIIITHSKSFVKSIDKVYEI